MLLLLFVFALGAVIDFALGAVIDFALVPVVVVFVSCHLTAQMGKPDNEAQSLVQIRLHFI